MNMTLTQTVNEFFEKNPNVYTTVSELVEYVVQKHGFNRNQDTRNSVANKLSASDFFRKKVICSITGRNVIAWSAKRMDTRRFPDVFKDIKRPDLERKKKGEGKESSQDMLSVLQKLVVVLEKLNENIEKLNKKLV